ncbi:hypothetical protein TTHERM_00590530 (macronuclear) [Tetrahymena thermophila SB210]|uniref:Uncharacterized protein n=1 Tax=Tetrahymena thermophila (strain SB210) TaxID=312017 RepID=I7M2C0_TETTS|nr:hypothetical protein TTHERM_00590530 [Tetrahymena thermophila SB210]EAR99716.1 hypothetical protein TTHERM_00590530 [Tetrahymena thermophila SB210]|eukprot:XP_001019961.1 hypothetical protein TTHERM_00590530 [Tetrahymena thermophila SB210]
MSVENNSKMSYKKSEHENNSRDQFQNENHDYQTENRTKESYNPREVYNLRVRAKRELEELQMQPLPYSSNYYEDLTREKEFIRNAFEANNYTLIRDLPNNLHHKIILEAKKDRVEKIKEQVNSSSFNNKQQNQSKVVKLIGGGYFTPFIYNDDEYEFAKEVAKFDKLKSLAKRLEISEKDFLPSDQQVKMKYEDPFHNKFGNKPQQYIFPSYVPEDTYDVLSESRTRQRLINAAKNIAGEFYPSQKDKTLQKVNKLNLEDVVNELRFILETDWPDSKFFLYVTNQDIIEVVFSMDSNSENDDPVVISVYMNSLINDERLTPYQLSKMVSDWSKMNTVKNTISFCFKPPWIKQTNTSEFSKLHPELIPNYKKSQSSSLQK